MAPLASAGLGWGTNALFRSMMDALEGSGHSVGSTYPPLTWDEYIDLLDRRHSSDPKLQRSSSGQHIPSSEQFFFDPTKRTGEIFWLKLCLCEAVCRSIAEEHERIGRSYGVLDPAQVVIQIADKDSVLLPLLWRVSLSIRRPANAEATQFADMPIEMAKGLVTMSVAADMTYAPPIIREWPPGRQLSTTALIQSADVIPDETVSTVRGLVRVHIVTDAIQARDFSDRDVFRVMLPVGTERGVETRAWARKVDSPERGIIVSGMTDPVTAEAWSAFARRVGQVESRASVAVYRSFASAYDVYSCGVLLLRALLGGDPGRWTRVMEALPQLLDGLSPLVEGIRPDDHYTTHIRIKDRLREWGDLFQCPHIAEDLWWDALIVALRACSRIGGFGYGYDQPISDRKSARDFARDMAGLSRRARIQLLNAECRDNMIAQVCDRVLAEL